mmetsp:Transcript_9810/g.16077  ORF Transcript_9810/g.16077 Transcript_9810/m.16077 type:complete len:353 (-) Transcript_9810:461-1519(-)
MANPAPIMKQPNVSFQASNDDDGSVDSNFDPEIPTIATSRSIDGLELEAISTALGSIKYDAATIRAEFKTYQSILPDPDELLQEQHSFTFLRTKIQKSGIEVPRFLKYNSEGGVKPHHAICCLLLSEYDAEQKQGNKSTGCKIQVYPLLVWILSFGYLHNQLNNPAEFIRDQFNRVAPAVPTETVNPIALRKKIKDRGLPVPNYFLDPDDHKQFPPHIALLVILQDGEKESRKLNSTLNRLTFASFALIALLLRIVLEVIGGAGAIWGGAEVTGLRTADNRELWRWISVAVGVLCYLRFVTLNAPQREDEGGTCLMLSFISTLHFYVYLTSHTHTCSKISLVLQGPGASACL